MPRQSTEPEATKSLKKTLKQSKNSAFKKPSRSNSSNYETLKQLTQSNPINKTEQQPKQITLITANPVLKLLPNETNSVTRTSNSNTEETTNPASPSSMLRSGSESSFLLSPQPQSPRRNSGFSYGNANFFLPEQQTETQPTTIIDTDTMTVDELEQYDYDLDNYINQSIITQIPSIIEVIQDNYNTLDENLKNTVGKPPQTTTSEKLKFLPIETLINYFIVIISYRNKLQLFVLNASIEKEKNQASIQQIEMQNSLLEQKRINVNNFAYLENIARSKYEETISQLRCWNRQLTVGPNRDLIINFLSTLTTIDCIAEALIKLTKTPIPKYDFFTDKSILQTLSTRDLNFQTQWLENFKHRHEQIYQELLFKQIHITDQINKKRQLINLYQNNSQSYSENEIFGDDQETPPASPNFNATQSTSF